MKRAGDDDDDEKILETKFWRLSADECVTVERKLCFIIFELEVGEMVVVLLKVGQTWD